jgi:hypothetical protein
MDKSKVIEFSNSVRDKLNAEVKSQAAYYGIFPKETHAVEEHADSVIINGKVFNSRIKNQRSQLVKRIKEKGYEQVMEEVTYTWFNRLVALKFMEMNGCLPDQIRVFTSADPNKLEPDILTNALRLDFLSPDRSLILDLKAENKDEELYKYLILKLCNYLHKIMPFLFEEIEDYTELLFPDKLLHTGSVLHDLNSIIPDEDWHEVENHRLDLSRLHCPKEGQSLCRPEEKHQDQQRKHPRSHPAFHSSLDCSLPRGKLPWPPVDAQPP